MLDVKKLEQDFINSRIEHNAELERNKKGLKTTFKYVSSVYTYQDLKGFKIVRKCEDEWYYISFIEECEPFRLKEKPLDEHPNLLSITYKDGRGAMVIDLDEFNKLPKLKQTKIMKLAEE